MAIARRQIVKGVMGSTACAATSMLPAFAQDSNEIIVGSLHDLSGGLEVYGRLMEDALRLAIDEINGAGGLLGKRVRIVAMDPQSDMVASAIATPSAQV